MLLADVDAEIGLITCVWSRIGQMTRQSTPVAHKFSLIPVSGVGGVVDEDKTEGKQRTQEHPRVTNIFSQNACALDEMCDMRHATRKTCACVCKMSCYLYTFRCTYKHSHPGALSHLSGQNLVWFPMILGLENMVCMSNLLGLQNLPEFGCCHVRCRGSFFSG